MKTPPENGRHSGHAIQNWHVGRNSRPPLSSLSGCGSRTSTARAGRNLLLDSYVCPQDSDFVPCPTEYTLQRNHQFLFPRKVPYREVSCIEDSPRIFFQITQPVPPRLYFGWSHSDRTNDGGCDSLSVDVRWPSPTPSVSSSVGVRNVRCSC